MIGDNAARRYAARVDAVLAQRTRLRGPQPPGDLFAGLPSDHPLLTADPRRPLDPNLEIIASYIEADDVIIDVEAVHAESRCRSPCVAERSSILSPRPPWEPALGPMPAGPGSSTPG